VPATIAPMWLFVTARSADGTGVNGPSVAVSFAVFGSSGVEVLVIALVIAPVTLEATATTRVIGALASTTSEPWVQLTVVEPEHVQPEPVPDTKVKPTGRGSPMVMVSTSDGPRFFTPMVNVVLVPGTTTPLCALVTATSACLMMVPVSVAELFARSGSPVGDETDAVLFAGPASAPEATDTTSTRGTLVAIAIDAARVHVTLVVPPHDHPGLDVETNVIPAGSESVTVIGPAAVDGPLLVTVTV
jgi:hypothetical protein